MLTKYILHIGSNDYELQDDDLKNWDEILCAYSRKDYNGVVRSFTSKFEFVGKAYDLLFEAYLQSGVKATADITILTITDNWEWEEQFSAPLDFSTISWDGITLSIAAIDNSLAALISSKKSTKYEFEVGKDIYNAGILAFDRVKMQNIVSHEIMDNVDVEHHGTEVCLAHSPNWKRVPTYVIGDAETYENSPVSFEDETDDAGSYFLKIEKNVDEVVIETDITFKNSAWSLGIFNGLEIHLKSFDAFNPNINDTYKELGCILDAPANSSMTYLGCFTSLDALRLSCPNPPQNAYAVIGKSNKTVDVEAVYMTPNTNVPERLEWLPGVPSISGSRGNTITICVTKRYIYRFTLKNVSPGTMIGLFYKGNVVWDSPNIFNEPSAIPITLTSIKTSWESKAKVISIDALSPTNVAKALLDKIGDGNVNTNVNISDFDSRIKDTYILAAESVRGISSAKFYSSFNEFCEWMQTVFGYTYYLGEKKENNGEETQEVIFCHRSELFKGDSTCHISSCRELSYGIDSSTLYGSIEVGYDKQDYETQCGRDEWNFGSSYTTGIDVSDKKLTLKSNYRADCYGLEFLAQKRAQDTTDDKSDNNVFFVLCEEKSSESDGDSEDAVTSIKLEIKRIATIEGALSDTVFNGEFSPYHCIKANEGFLASMCQPLTLTFASTDGNGDIKIDGVSVRSDISLTNPLFTKGELTFKSGDVNFPSDANALMEVIDNGVLYRGFLKEVDIKYARAETAKYKLIVKDIVP